MKNIFSKFLMAAVLLIVLSACATGTPSNEGGETNNSNNTNNATDNDSASKDNVTIAYPENVQTLDPHDSSAGIDNSVLYSMYESLFTPDESGELQPWLATDYELSDDGLTYTFTLVEDAEFSDGEAFNAEAVKANLDRIIESDGALNNFKSVRDVVDVKVQDDYKIDIELEDVNSQFIEKIGTMRMVSPQAISDDADYSSESYGTGPFVLEKWSPGESIVVKKNENYRDSDYPKVNQLTFKPIPEDGSRVAMLKTGEVDYAFPIPVKDVENLQNEEGLVVDTFESTYVNYVTINSSKAPFDDVKVRQAMNYAVDKEAYIQVVKNGFAVESKSPLPEANNFYKEQETYDYDIEKAKELLKEAGYEDGFEAEIWGSDSSKDKLGMQFIQQQLAEIGIDVDVKQMERGTLSDEINKPETPEDSTIQMWYVGWSSTVGNADNAINPLFTTNSFPPNGYNTAYYSNEKVDKLTDEALHANTEEDAADKYGELQEIIMDEAPWLFLGVDEEPTGMSEDLEGIWRSADGNFYLQDIHWK